MNAIGFNFFYKYAKAYFIEHGHLLISQNFIMKEKDEYNKEIVVRLGSWINRMRTSYRKQSLSSIEIERLNDIGMIWDVNEYTFDQNYALAKVYYEKYNNLLVPETYIVNGVHLGAWIASLRLIYNGKKQGILTDEQIVKMNNIGMIWQAKVDKIDRRSLHKRKLMLEKSFLLFLDNYSKNAIDSKEDINEINKQFIKSYYGRKN